ncbi:hypothetical protein B0H16DRAFT_1728468 [Mycena metata]|uniref:DUF6532 domain-containing protein n=1 Tax=Mycena metata TaxID=1033252 RepID=A0AAD7IHD8_9AGAR|nr:hypothetical protein B0H16DRAFT_1728468 [Mycena metata]
MKLAVSSNKKADLSSPKHSKAKAKAKQAAQSPKACGVTKPKATNPKATKPNNVSTEASTSTKTKRTNEKENIDQNNDEDLFGRGRRAKTSTQERLERDSLKIWANPPKKRKATQDALEQEEDNDAAPPPKKRKNVQVPPESPLRLTPPAPSKSIPAKYMVSPPPRHASGSQQSQAFHRRSPSRIRSPTLSPRRIRSPTLSPPRLDRQYKHSYQVIHSDNLDGALLLCYRAYIHRPSDMDLDLQDQDDSPGGALFGVYSDGIPNIVTEEDTKSNNEEDEEDEEDELEGGDATDDPDDATERMKALREEDRQRRERRRQEQQDQEQGGKRGASSQGAKDQDARREDRRDREDHRDRREDRRDHRDIDDRRQQEQQDQERGGKGGASSQGAEDRGGRPERPDRHKDRREDHDEDGRKDREDHRDRRDKANGGKRRGGSPRGGDGQEDLDPDHGAHGKTASSLRTSSNHHPPRTGKSGPSGNQKGRTGTGTGQGGDVLAQYRVKNRATRPPDPRKLAAHAQRQTRVEENSEADNNSDNDDSDEEEEEEETGLRRRKPRTATGVVTSLHEGFYPPFFRKTINITKIKAFEDLLNGYLFPDFDRLRPKIVRWLIEAIHYCEEDLELIQPEGIWEEYQTDLAKLIWKFVSTFRGRCRDLSREVVPVLYKIRPSLDDFEGGFGQAEYADKMKDNVETLLKDYNFLKHGFDAEGHTNNMMHPAISELIFRIVHKPHKSEDSLAKSLPEEFGVYTGELVAAVALFLQVGLEEYATGQFLKVRFTEEIYHKTYKNALRSITKLKGNREHWGKTTARWAQWEAEHTIEVGKPNASAEGMVTLD